MDDNYSFYHKNMFDALNKLEGWSLVLYLAFMLLLALGMSLAFSWFF